MAYRLALIRMTLSYLQGHSPTAGLLKYDFSYTVVQQLTIFQPRSDRRSPSGIKYAYCTYAMEKIAYPYTVCVRKMQLQTWKNLGFLFKAKFFTAVILNSLNTTR